MTDTVPPAPAREKAPVRTPAWPRWVMRIMTLVTAIMLFDQAIFAGQFLSGVYPMLRVHADNATSATLVVLLLVVAAVLLRWPGRGPWWPILASAGLLVLVVAQMVLGYSRVLAIHIPLGVAIIVLAVGLAVWAWRR